MTTILRVWDAPTRFFHWALVICVIGLVITAELGGAALDWHFRLGYFVLSLLLFRVFWGFVGGYWSRFINFLFWPSQTLDYLRGRGMAAHGVGHNPAGALSVFGLLGFLAFQVVSGLLSDDEIAAAGPLTRFVSNAMVSNATFYHKEIGKLVLLALITLHVAAIIFYFVKKRENLVQAMLTGDKEINFTAPSATDTTRSRSKAILIFLFCSLTVFGLFGWLA